MSGYASRNKPSEGKVHDLYAKALALEDPAGGRMVVVTTDLVGLSRTVAEEVALGVKKNSGLARERLLLTSSHTHTGPVIRDSLFTMYDLNPEQTAVVRQYTDKLVEQLIELVGTGARRSVRSADLLRNRAGRLRRQPPRGFTYGIQDWSQRRRAGGPQRSGAADR